MTNPDAPNPPDATDVPAASPLDTLTRAQVFARDPEQLTHAHLQFALEEIRKILARHRKARADDAAVADTATKMKKANATTRKKKPTATVAADILDTKL